MLRLGIAQFFELMSAAGAGNQQRGRGAVSGREAHIVVKDIF